MKNVFLAFMLLGLAGVCNAAPVGARSCHATSLSNFDSKKLLEFLPAALVSRQYGGKLSVVRWSAHQRYHKDYFSFFMVLTTATKLTSLENGVIGYFAVNKWTADVLELD